MASQSEPPVYGSALKTSRGVLLTIFVVVAACVLIWLVRRRADPLAAARSMAAQGKVEQACENLRCLVGASSGQDSARLLLATLQAGRDPVEALEVLAFVRPDGDEHADAVRLFGQIIVQMENEGTAKGVLLALAEQHPDNILLAKTLASVAIRSGDNWGAEEAAQRVVKLAPNDPEALLLLADAFDGVGRRIDMIEPLSRVLDLVPDSYVAHANLAYALRHAGKLDAALQQVRWCLNRNPADAAVSVLKGQILRDQGRREEALALIRGVTRAEPRNVDAKLLEAELLLFEQDFHAALNLLLSLDVEQLNRHDIRQVLARARKLAGENGVRKSSAPQTARVALTASEIRFEDVAEERGLTFQHLAPLTDQRHTHLVMGGGLGWLDFDRDGWPDLFLGQGRPFDIEHPLARDSIDPKVDREANDRIFQNQGGREFRDVTDQCQIWNPDYTTGIAIGDWNNDGFDDVFTGCFGPNRFFINQGDGTFAEMSEELGLDDAGFAASSTWFDANQDGNLDLFVTSYLDFDPYDYRICHVLQDGRDLPVSCHPRHETPVMDMLFLGNGAGGFLNVTQTCGLAAEPPRQGLGIAAADFDFDGDCDVYVANDAVANQLWVNHEARFVDQAVSAGVALNRAGEREAGMGVVVGDVTGDGLLDVFVTNYFGETNTLYRGEGNLLFLDVTDESGLGSPSRARLGFGATLLDADNDGWLDLFVANGHVIDRLGEFGQAGQFAQQGLMFRNAGAGRFTDVSATAGKYFQNRVVGRGSAAADFDRDGRVDIAVQHLNGRCGLLRNETVIDNSIFHVDLIGTKSPRCGIGAIVTLESRGHKLLRLRNGSSSYLSCDDGTLSFSVDPQADDAVLTVLWPSGRPERIETTLGRIVIVEGQSGAAMSQ